jgi:glycosyltransferase involved in cell wall biosynthesis/ubiquinone/menaquinone biosynthesis C-methylase UbiE
MTEVNTGITQTGVTAVSASTGLAPAQIVKVAELLLSSCGNGKLLHVGNADLAVVQHFLTCGVDALNVSTDETQADDCSRQMPQRFLHWDGQRLPFEDGQFSTVLLTEPPSSEALLDIGFAKELLRVCSGSLFLYLDSGLFAQPSAFRKACEALFFQAGARKHPAYYRVNDYQSLQVEQGRLAIPLEKLPVAAALAYPLSALVEERDLHMDMTREPGSRSDAHIIRYMLASRYVRPGDRILDAACGLGYGAHTLAKCSDAKSVLGIDGSEYAIRYAELNFAANGSDMSFKEGWLPDAIHDIPDNSIDLITSFETLEHVKDPKALLAEFYRVLTPSGRIVLSVPNDWSDETGEDPNPFHFHVYTWAKILAETQAHFLVESAFVQTADQYKKHKQWAVGTRQLYETPVDELVANDPECEWCLLVGMKSPLLGAEVPYTETTYDLYPQNPNWQVTRFDDYRNPWLVKGLVTIGHRLTNPALLKGLSDQVAEASSKGSPDQGAGLCVKGYQLYADRTASRQDVDAFEALCRSYLDTPSTSPQHLRWQVSLCYLLAQLFQKWGESAKAVAYYQSCIGFDCAAYSPTLITKQIHAYRNLGLIASGQGDQEKAAQQWRLAVQAAERALSLDWSAAYGSLDNPSDFGLHELGAIVEGAASCSYALKYIDNAVKKTPQWWHQLARDRASQLGSLDALRIEIHRLNLVLSDKDRQLTSSSQGLDQHIAQKDHELNRLGLEQHRLNLLINAKNEQLHELGNEVTRLHEHIAANEHYLHGADPALTLAQHTNQTKAAEIDRLLNEVGRLGTSLIEQEIALQQATEQMMQLESVIESKNAELDGMRFETAQLTLLNHEKDHAIETISEQLAAVQQTHEHWVANSTTLAEHQQLQAGLEQAMAQLQQIQQSHQQQESIYRELRQTRLLRWRDAVAARPLTLRGVAKAAFMTGSLLTPRTLRDKLRSPTALLIERLRSRPAPANTGGNPESGYLVKQPKRLEPQRPIIVHVIANFMTGGSSRLVVDIFEHLGHRYDQRVVTSFAPQPPAYVGIPIEEIRFPNDEQPFVEMYKALKPDFIHMHYWGDCDEPWYAKAVRGAEVLGIPVIQNINTPVVPYYSDAIKRYVYVSDYVRSVFGKPENHHVTVYPGSDFSMFESKSKRKVENDCIGMVYRLESDKLNSDSIMPFILAVQKKPTIKVVIVGGGSLLEEFVGAVAEANLSDNFEFTGYVSYDALPAIYERMNIFVAPVWKESFGQVSPFAMNMRVPVVGFDVGAIGEIVQDPSLLAPPGNSEALANIIVSLLDDAPRRLKVAEQHRKRARDAFSVQAMIKGYQTIYSDTMVKTKK